MGCRFRAFLGAGLERDGVPDCSVLLSGSPDHGQRFIEAGAMGLRGLAQAVPAALHYRRGIETAAGPSLDRAMAEGFLGHFPPASHCFQLFADTPNGPRTLARTIHGTLGDVWPHLAALNTQGAGVYFRPYVAAATGGIWVVLFH